MSVLAIDPGYDRLGWCIGHPTSLRLLAYGCITTPKSEPTLKRYQLILKELDLILEQHHPQFLATETLFFNKNITTAIKVAEVRGLLFSVALRRQISIAEYSPSQIKLASAGHGQADKASIAKMVSLQLKIPLTGLLDDTIDAMAIYTTHQALFSSKLNPK